MLIFFGRQDLKRARWLPPFNDKVVKEAILHVQQELKKEATRKSDWTVPRQYDANDDASRGTVLTSGQQ